MRGRRSMPTPQSFGIRRTLGCSIANSLAWSQRRCNLRTPHSGCGPLPKWGEAGEHPDDTPHRLPARLVARGALRGRVLGHRRAVLPRPICARPERLQRDSHRRRPDGLHAPPGLPPRRLPYRLQASAEPHRLDLPRGRPVVDAPRPVRLLQRVRPRQARLGPLPGGDGRLKSVAVGAHGWAAGSLPGPAVPRREAAVREVASPRLALGGGDCVARSGRGALPRSDRGARGCAQPVWAGRAALVGGRDQRPLGRVPRVHRGIGSEPRVALPALRGEERQQIKWIALAASVVGLGFVGAMLSGLLAPALAPELWREANAPPLWFEFFFSLVLLSFGGVPTAVGIAVLKYRLYDIDLLINRALVYGSLTFALVFSYVVSVVVLQALFRALTGQGSQLAVVASTLTIAALFSPLRRRLQAFVDRRFYREKYDARRTLELFSARLRAETDLEMLGEHLVGAVGEVMRPAHASLWLHPKGARHGKPAEQEKDVS